MGAGEAGEGPLTRLADALRGARPHSLSSLVMQVEDVETYQDFVRLVDEYLPDQRQDIIQAGSPEDMVMAFARRFGDRYFPLADHLGLGDIESLSDLMRFIPIDVHGYDYDDYHSLCDERPSALLSSLLVDFEEELGIGEEGVRVTILEAAVQHVSQELLGHIPGQGYSLEYLEQVLPGSKYEGLLDRARHLCHTANNVFLDVTGEEFWSNPPEWSREQVDYLTQEWRKANEMQDRMVTFFKWLEEDLKPNFARLLRFLGAIEAAPPPPPEQMRLPLEGDDAEEEDDY
ncbi:MAG: hypothetical protein V3U26_05065 [Dehalococcoidia bacterium]